MINVTVSKERKGGRGCGCEPMRGADGKDGREAYVSRYGEEVRIGGGCCSTPSLKEDSK